MQHLIESTVKNRLTQTERHTFDFKTKIAQAEKEKLEFETKLELEKP